MGCHDRTSSADYDEPIEEHALRALATKLRDGTSQVDLRLTRPWSIWPRLDQLVEIATSPEASECTRRAFGRFVLDDLLKR